MTLFPLRNAEDQNNTRNSASRFEWVSNMVLNIEKKQSWPCIYAIQQHAMKTYRVVEACLHTFLTSAIGHSECSVTFQLRRKNLSTQWIESRVGPTAGRNAV